MKDPRTSAVLNELMDDKGEIYEGNCPEKLVKLARQLETELAAMTKERDEAIQVSAIIASERACLMVDLKAEREKCAKLREVLQLVENAKSGTHGWVVGNLDAARNAITKALEATK